MKTQITFDDELAKKIDEKAKELFVSRSAWVNMACSEKIKNEEIIKMFPDLLKKMDDLNKSQK